MQTAYSQENRVFTRHLSTPTGRLVVGRHPLLRRHAGTEPDLILRWNAMTQPTRIDVVVHLHGYSHKAQAMRLDLHKEPMSGLDFREPGGAGPAGRTQPTLAILPRGHWEGDQPGKRRDRYTFPALVGRGALRLLVDDALARFAAATGIRAGRGRLILTAHSGGGAPLMAILLHTDPDEVHIFDGLYQNPENLIRWAQHRIAGEARPSSSPNSPLAGALRVLCRPGTQTAVYSAEVQRAVHTALRAVPGTDIARRYRVEGTPVEHNDIPRRYGWRLLLDASADLPNTSAQLSLAIPGSRSPELDRGRLAGGGWKEHELWGQEPGLTDQSIPKGTGRTLVRPRVLSTALLRKAWREYSCAENRMALMTLFGRWRTPVNPKTVVAWRALEQALAATGYPVHRAWVFNCRNIENQTDLSLHAYGLAIDIDHAEPRCNVNRKTPDGRAVRFSSATTKQERCRDVQRGAADTSFTPKQVAAVEAITTIDGHQVFTWGGRWRTTKDTMHFQLNVTPAELARGIRRDSVQTIGVQTIGVQMIGVQPPTVTRLNALDEHDHAWEGLGEVGPNSTPGASLGPFGTLSVTGLQGSRFTYRFTAEDVLWTARFIVGEAGGRDNLDNQAVIWSMFNRYALFTHPYHSTFHRFIRAYSTPLQPVLNNWGAAKRHMHSSSFVRTGGTYPPPAPPGIPRGQLQRHLDIQRTPWRRLPASARSLAERALRGQIPNPIGNASEFDSTWVYFRDHHHRDPSPEEWCNYTTTFARKGGLIWIGPVVGINQKNNAFFVQARVRHLPPNAVQVT